VLAPWPNRLGGGRYAFDGREAHAALDEPENGTAIHGLVRWMPWRLVSAATDAVVLACVLHPQPAYPWRLELMVSYRLGPDGLTSPQKRGTSRMCRRPSGSGFIPT
jgi:galactose mutarotase-like enzyme